MDSGIPRATVSGHLVLLLFTNDIGDDIDSSIKLFGNDSFFSGEYNNNNDGYF